MYKTNITKHLEWEFQNEITKAIEVVNNYWMKKINHPFGYVEWEAFRFNQSVKLKKPMSEEVFREMLLVNMGINVIIKLIYDLKQSELIKLQNANKILNTTLFTDLYFDMINEIEKLINGDKNITWKQRNQIY